MSQPVWDCILAHSPDPTDPTGELDRIGVIGTASNKTLDIVRNRAGSFSFTIDVKDDVAYDILDKVDLGDVRGTVRKCVIVRRDKKPIWSGPIWTIQGNLSEGGSKMNIGCVGWLEYVYQRMLYADVSYNNMERDNIAHALMALVSLQDPDHPLPIFPGDTFGNMGIISSHTFLKGEMLGACLQKLSDVESGFDMDVDPISRNLNLYAWDTYKTRTNVKLGYNWGPSNINALGWSENGGATRNSIIAVSGTGVPVAGADISSQDEYGLFEETINLPEGTAGILIPYVNAEIVIKSRPMVTYTLTPRPASEEDEDSPRLFEDYFIGDKIFFTAKEGAFVVQNQAIRVFGANVGITDEGIETVNSIQTTPAT